MTTTRRSGPDHPCVLPGDPAWLQDAGYLFRLLDILASVASMATDEDPTRYGLPAITYMNAAGLISRLARGLPTVPPPSATVRLLSLPAWELEALWDVVLVLRRTRAHEPDTIELAEFVQGLGSPLDIGLPALDVVTTGLERVIAVLALDIPAVRTLTAAHILQTPHDTATQDACTQIRTAWKAAGVPH
ncbi:hypothetical protein SAVIM338S_07248 [Streptomyces avidinii]